MSPLHFFGVSWGLSWPRLGAAREARHKASWADPGTDLEGEWTEVEGRRGGRKSEEEKGGRECMMRRRSSSSSSREERGESREVAGWEREED